MHIFLAIIAAGVTLYLLRNWWERLQERRVARRLNPSPRSRFGQWCDKLDRDHAKLELEWKARAARAGRSG
jgi:hypothetical protein